MALEAPVCRTESYRIPTVRPTASSLRGRCSPCLTTAKLTAMADILIPRSSGPFKLEPDQKRLATVVVDGRAVPYQDLGHGPTVILAHGSGRTNELWASLGVALSSRYRVLAPRLLGYGRVEPRSGTMRLHPWSDCAAVLALTEQVGESVHIVGHSYGGTVALEAARALGRRTRSLTLIEPIAFHLLGLAGHPRDRHDIPTYARLDAPTRLIVGQHTAAPARAIVDELVGVLPNSHLRIVPHAGHMSPLTHAAEVAELIGEHIDRVEDEYEPDGCTPECEGRRSIA
jgi:pimeloyl-ACP methyl ester carboxylesterase